MAIKLDTKLDLTNNKTYKESSLKVLEENIGKVSSISELKNKLDDINCYENLDKLEEPKEIYTFDDEIISDEKIKKAKLAVLNGSIFFEHAAAGEATRLKLGTKYVINISKKLTTKSISEMMSEEAGTNISEEEVLKQSTCNPEELLSFSLGTRHMAQLCFDIKKLAEEFNRNPKAVLSMQKMLLILNDTTAEQILEDFKKHNFFQLNPNNIFFLIQRRFNGINLKDGEYFYDENAPLRLHNHGQMVMQSSLDDEVFHLDPENDFEKRYLKSEEFGQMLKQCDDKISYNIEDIGYLTKSIDFASLAVALDMKERGYNMMMEIVANNPIKPQKGGMAAFDPVISKNVMIESFQLKGVKNEDIKFLNKNFNHYPDPYIMWSKMKERGLPMPIAVKEDYIYFQPVQGDINFLVKTQFVRRKILKPIQNWKSPATTPATISAMKKQDELDGFKEFMDNFLNIKEE
jgi:hypothetical protein